MDGLAEMEGAAFHPPQAVPPECAACGVSWYGRGEGGREGREACLRSGEGWEPPGTPLCWQCWEEKPVLHGRQLGRAEGPSSATLRLVDTR